MTSATDTIELQNRNGDTDGRNRLTPELYARLVLGFAKHSKHPVYPGKHYTALARLLTSPYQRLSTDAENPTVEETNPNAIYLYDLAVDSGKPERIHTFNTIDEIDHYDEESRRKEQGGRLIFLQGYLAPKWLNHNGSKFEIDPEFYLRHLDFSSSVVARALSNAFSAVLRRDYSRPHDVDDMTEYLKSLGQGKKVVPSDLIVRHFSVFDTHHFAIEQAVTMHVNYDNPGWTALIWLDQGRDLHLSRHGPWRDLQRGNASSLATQPIIQYRKRIALQGGGAPRPPNGQASSGHQLASTYGSSLRPEALDEIFRLAIASESQFLTFVLHEIKRAITDDQIQDLQHVLALVEDHCDHIRENLSSVKSGGHAKWPKAPKKLRATALANKEQLQKDLEYLLVYSEHLVDRCTGGISVMMNEAMFKQSQRAIEQTEATIKLRFAGFLFRASFRCDFFLFNVGEGGERDAFERLGLGCRVCGDVGAVICAVEVRSG
ncbi:uncharacterized protein BDZ99DRAFT_576849 [Mytilinidion resinicola]|uniref:Uncharacterized protein n=1 Tax=Mytilinidion resinicola TaxID=574789 RepID=A0A6A6Y1Q0_9PEZI|nr:uncharacterized protein BDZ99DRAFT_576849 [Mytilinidion resinicola]KAF2802478.1 hypothetical protein BDZ99DRAFT_576849 [Mytilinidion resinicola]